MIRTTYSVNEISSLGRYTTVFNEHELAALCDCPFIFPFWLRTWLAAFGKDSDPRIIEIYADDMLLGIAPLMQQGDTVTFLGSESVCDYQDVIVTRQAPQDFFIVLLDYLKAQGIPKVILGALTPESRVLEFLPQLCSRDNVTYHLEPVETFSILRLPASWDSYLKGLTGKNRHEIRRKLRRLHEAGEVDYRDVLHLKEVPERIADFLQMFSQSRQDKAEFLTRPMEEYFFKLADELAKNGMLNLGVLSLNSRPIATTFGFIFKNSLYLYNNGFDSAYSHLSSGLMCKIMAVRQSIAKGMNEFNFLKGDERYKRQLGGEKIPLQRLEILL